MNPIKLRIQIHWVWCHYWTPRSVLDWVDIDIWLRFSLIFDLELWLNNIIPKRAIIYKQNLALTQQITFWLVKRIQDFVKGATPPWGATGSDWLETFPPPRIPRWLWDRNSEQSLSTTCVSAKAYFHYKNKNPKFRSAVGNWKYVLCVLSKIWLKTESFWSHHLFY